jgi:SSS family solute:Na+ symporter
VWSYLTVTGSIYLSSMSTLLIACCYWKRANNWGAIAAIVCGAAFPLSFLVLEKQDSTVDFAKAIGPNYSGIAAYVAAATAMIVGSMLKNFLRPASTSPSPSETSP